MNKQPFVVSYRNLMTNLSTLALVSYLACLPLYKYGEYVYGLPRVNATVVCTLFLSALLFVVLLGTRKKRAGSAIYVISLYAIACVSMLQLVQLPLLMGQIDAVLIGKYMSRTFVASILLFVIGLSLTDIVREKGGWFLVAWLLSVAIYLWNVMKSQSVFVYLDGEQIYLMLADAFAVLSILTVFVAKDRRLQLAIFGISLIVLFTLVSRTSFFFFAVAFLVYLGRIRPIVSLAIAGCALATVLLMWPTIVDFLGESNRMIRIVTTGEDSSLDGRLAFMTNEFRHLSDNWILGQFMYDVVATGKTGTYAHNYMSFLTAYGVLPFVLILLSLMYLGISFVIKGASGPIAGAYVCCLVFITLEIAASRSYLHPYVWLVLGGSISYREIFKRSSYIGEVQQG